MRLLEDKSTNFEIPIYVEKDADENAYPNVCLTSNLNARAIQDRTLVHNSFNAFLMP
jgi:hypothetical protein